ncbi:MAG: immunity 17 family protein [Peptostreptococcaceae bacterium]|nr:immunity 17 family protein [Peptostreptococcaceae bacterium]
MVVMILLVAVGLFSVMAAILNWDFFFNSSKARIWVRLFGRNGARIFYILLGAAIIVLGILSQVGR